MSLFAALLAGISVYLAVGYLTGYAPALPWKIARETPGLNRRQVWLAQAGVQLTPGQFWFGSAVLSLIVFAIAFAITGVPWVAAPPAVALGLLPRWYFGRKRLRRLSEVNRAWPDGLRHIVASLRAGMSVSASLDELSRTGPEPLRRAFVRVPALARTLGVDAALAIIREELADPASDRVIEVLLVASERGGAIVPEVLIDLADATTRDLRVAEEIQTAVLEQRINGSVVFVVPWLVLLLLTSQPGAFRDFYASPAGIVVVAIGVLVSLLGAWLVARLSREHIEPRVLGASAPVPPPSEGLSS